MKIIIHNIKLGLDDDPEILTRVAAHKLHVKKGSIHSIRILKESIDARKKSQIHFIYSILVETEGMIRLPVDPEIKELVYDEQPPIIPGDKKLTHRPIIVGSGPAGLFAALQLAQMGYKPLILERGDEVTTRSTMVHQFWHGGTLDTESNVQFGEGGAGTFSDGKLTTRINDPRCEKVLSELHTCGIPQELLYKSRPHIGTDKLKGVLLELRKRIIGYGGEFRFRTRVEKLLITHNQINGVKLANGEKLPADVVVLAIGHSARDTFQSLYGSGVTLIQKSFSIGLRIEHPQELINQAQYGPAADHPRLGAAEYALFHKMEERTAYTFCMCPGGLVVAAASEDGGIVTNGMSEFARNRVNANSAFVASVGPTDFGSSHPLAGMEIQRELEHRAWLKGGSTYAAPVQRLSDFINGVNSDRLGSISPSYTGDTLITDLNQCLPDSISSALKTAVPFFDRKMKGFALGDAVLTGVETRTSSPVRILRDEQYQSVSTKGLYPAGEGAGYAGGIMSAAVDGLRVSEQIIRTFSEPSNLD